MSMLKIKKGDTVKVIAGKDKDKEGKVIAVNQKTGKVIVEGVNMLTKRKTTLFKFISSLMIPQSQLQIPVPRSKSS